MSRYRMKSASHAESKKLWMPSTRFYLQVKRRLQGKEYILSVAEEMKMDHGSRCVGSDSYVVASGSTRSPGASTVIELTSTQYMGHMGTPQLSGTNRVATGPRSSSSVFLKARLSVSLLCSLLYPPCRHCRGWNRQERFCPHCIRALGWNTGDLELLTLAWGLVSSRRGHAPDYSVSSFYR